MIIMVNDNQPELRLRFWNCLLLVDSFIHSSLVFIALCIALCIALPVCCLVGVSFSKWDPRYTANKHRHGN